MPCPHNEISIVQRSQQQSAVAAAAYQSGEKLFCEYDQEVKHQPDGAAAGCDLAAGKGAEFEICDTGLDVWVNDANIIWNEKKQDNGK